MVLGKSGNVGLSAASRASARFAGVFRRAFGGGWALFSLRISTIAHTDSGLVQGRVCRDGGGGQVPVTLRPSGRLAQHSQR